ncbi:DUF4209 domain-containing protein [Egibacter rhizosphaerae]|uniref:DUF4209 domain-containing protein n=1 Tax=Egibacter rhizosphaerae TaxID=1670831 RepID=A0A411YCH2_9ACTN|nr:DUF4209 domain-containing protein [Egibacter rhizosphaerae]QBI18862.1 DUF4209 domain-containing protein [Egibacter rhizosphaerae]
MSPFSLARSHTAASLKEFAFMEAGGARELATLADEAALDAEDMHDIASTLRGHVAEGRDDVDQLLEAFEYVHQLGEGRGRFIPAMQMGERTYPVPLERVPQDTLAIWTAVATFAEHPAVRARLQDLLFHRRVDNGRERASSAVDAYLELSRRWPTIQAAVELLPRALDLSQRVGLSERVNAGCSLALDLAAEQLDHPQPKPGAPLQLLRSTIEVGCDDPRVDELLQRARDVLPSLWDTKSTIELQLRRVAGDERHPLNRQLVLRHLDEAEQHTGMRRARLLQDAAELARDRQLPDLHKRSIRHLQQLHADDLEMETIETEVQVPAEEIRKVFEAYLDASDWREALERFAFLQVPTGTTERNRRQVAEQQQDSPLLSMVSTVIYDADAMPIYRPSTEEERFEFDLVRTEAFHLQFWAHLAADVLRELPRRFGSPPFRDLESWLSEAPHVSDDVARSIRRALKHFWAGEYEASVAVGIPRIEAMVRQLLLQADAAIYRLQRGDTPGQYPGLLKLVEALEGLGLPETIVRYLNTAFTRATGLNLRNAFAHGALADPSPQVAAIVCHALVFLARLPVAADNDDGSTDGQ